MKKLLFIHHRLVCGGAENALFNLLTSLDKTKYDISVFVLHSGGEWEQRFRDAGIRILHSYSRLVPGRRLRNFVLRKRIEHARKRGGMGLIPLAVAEKFDLAVVYHITKQFTGVGILDDCRKVWFIHAHATQTAFMRDMITGSLPALRQYDRVVCVSEDVRRSFVELTGETEKTCVCYNVIDDALIRRGSREAVEEKLPKPYICAVGRLSREKGFERLIRIHKRLRDEGLQHGLVIVGDGPDMQPLKELIRTLGAEDSVVLTGYRSNPYPYIQNSLFTVCSSYSEGLHIASMESLCLGVPVVAAVEPVRELFGGVCCGIITENDDESLAVGIRKMLTDPAFYEKALQGAMERGSAFTAGALAAEVESVFDFVMEG